MPQNPPLTLDPEIREYFLKFFTNCINHSYANSTLIRILLKAQNLTINDILIPSAPTEFVTPTPITQEEQNLKTELDKVINNPTPRINPTPSKLDIDDLEFCFNNLTHLTPSRQKFITDNFRSRKDNAVTDYDGKQITPPMRRYLTICVNIIKKDLENKRIYHGRTPPNHVPSRPE